MVQLFLNQRRLKILATEEKMLYDPITSIGNPR